MAAVAGHGLAREKVGRPKQSAMHTLITSIIKDRKKACDFAVSLLHSLKLSLNQSSREERGA
jgi:hypothetical protein